MHASVLRVCAAAVLLAQLQLFALPALCGPARAPSAACEFPMNPAPGASAVGVRADTSPCASAALCGAPAPAVAHPLLLGLGVADVARGAFFPLSSLHPGDSPAPLPPPPQA